MAKGSLIGFQRGKIGNLVMSVNNSKQVIRIHRDTIANPRTNLQMLQRAKVNLAGQVSRIVSKEMITGLAGGSASARRSVFMKELLAATSSSIDRLGAITASLPAAKISFSHGDAELNGITLTPVYSATQSSTLVINAAAADTADSDVLSAQSANIVILLLDPTTGRYDNARLENVVLPTTAGQTRRNTFQIPEDRDVYVYAIPMNYDVSEARNVALSFIGADLEEVNDTDVPQIIATLVRTGVLTSLKYGESGLIFTRNGFIESIKPIGGGSGASTSLPGDVEYANIRLINSVEDSKIYIDGEVNGEINVEGQPYSEIKVRKGQFAITSIGIVSTDDEQYISNVKWFRKIAGGGEEELTGWSNPAGPLMFDEDTYVIEARSERGN